MKVITISDLHGYLPEPEYMPEVDVVCICGDICPLEVQRNYAECKQWYYEIFVPWAKSLNCKKVVFIAGNHDFFLERFTPDNDDKIIYLNDSSVTIDGKMFYGTPWVFNLSRWAFNKDEVDLYDTFSYIPYHCDVLLTHTPPAIAEVGTVRQSGWNFGRDFGSMALADAMYGRDIFYTFCGHIHSGEHTPYLYPGQGDRQHWVVNVSIKDEDYKVQTFYFPIYNI